MNPFVNPHKRSVLLPSGCKDLIDVLRRIESMSEESGFIIKPERFEEDGLAHIHHYVTRMVESSAKAVTLYIKSLNGECAVGLRRSASEFSMHPLMGIVEREKAVKEFFARRVIEPIADFLVGHAGMPTRVLAFSLPPTATVAAALTIDLMCEVYGFKETSGIEFTYLEDSGV